MPELMKTYQEIPVSKKQPNTSGIAYFVYVDWNHQKVCRVGIYFKNKGWIDSDLDELEVVSWLEEIQ